MTQKSVILPLSSAYYSQLPASANYTYDNEGRVTTLVYPAFGYPSASGMSLSYGLDSMGRAYSATVPAYYTTYVSSATYGPSNELLTIPSLGETRTYNANVQLTNLVSGSYSYQYNCS